MTEWMINSFKQILDDISSGIIICDPALKIMYINKFYAHLLSTRQEDAIGMDIRNFFPDSRVPYVFRSGRVELRQPCCHRAEIIGHDTDITLLINRIPLKKNGKTVAVVIETIFKDILQVKDFMVKNNLLKQKVRDYKLKLESAFLPTFTLDSIIGRSKKIIEAKETAKKFASSDTSILILGDTGVGKELFAHALHCGSRRSNKPFVCVNCAAIPNELIESELFGYEEGAFTGAKKFGKIGKIELANNGTLFLDEIGDLPLNSQAKLLRVLETKFVEKLGSTKPLKINFRLVSSTNVDLEEIIRRKEFREDLYYRIQGMTLTVPPLSERREDIPILAEHLIATSNHPHLEISEEALDLLCKYEWPGNIRELRNTIESSAILTNNRFIEPKHLPEKICRLRFKNKLKKKESQHLIEQVRDFEKIVIKDTLKISNGNKVRASKLLGISRSTLYDKCTAYGLM